MNRFQPREGTQAPYWSHMAYIADSADEAMRGALADYIALSPDFFINGGVITETPAGTSMNYAITAGHVCYKGEVMPVDAHSIVKTASQVVFMTVQDDAADVTPVPNLDGTTDYVLRRRHLRLRVASVYPSEHMVITAPRKEVLDRLRMKGRILPSGGIVPYFGTMDHFSSTGLGLTGTPLDGFAVCNGLNGTPDLRGMTPIGAVDVPDTGASAVYAGVQNTTSIGDKVGSDSKLIDADNLPAHTHDYLDRAAPFVGGGGTHNLPNAGGDFDFDSDESRVTSANSTAHNALDVRQPSFALVFIMSIV